MNTIFIYKILTHRRKLILVLLFFIICISVFAQADRKFIRQGNNRYSDNKYPESEISYRKAIDKNKMSQDAAFNLGDALYKQNKYDEAGKIFKESSDATTEKLKRANSFYNLGNSLLNSKKPEESIGAYKNALKLDPGNKQAKYNLAYAQDMLKRQQEQQKQNRDKDKQDKKDQKDQNKNNKDNKDQNKDQQKQDQQKKQDNQQQQQQQQEISKEDAQRLLDALANDEKKVQEKVKEDKAAKARVKTTINW